MPLTPGSRIGVFTITGPIGVGGMGEVYQATDTNLKRQVAIKVLPASVAGDADRLARFQREAEVLAALNHPHIAAIYGLEKTPDGTALVMELVEGDDLSQRIALGAIPIDEALPIAKQIAEALEAAHEQGIIHRDLKPANIKVRADGTVKVLDFGLAKALEPQGCVSPSTSLSPTLTTPAMTQAGMILGTAAYMAPEQAKGRTVDRRADIWAFGAVLFEMLTGTRAFAGADVQETFVALDQLHHQRGAVGCFFEAVDRRDVGVVEGRQHFGFALKARQAVRIARHRRGQHLDRHLAFQIRVGGLIDLPHAADPNFGGDAEDAELGAGGEGHTGAVYGPARGRPRSIPSAPVATAACWCRAPPATVASPLTSIRVPRRIALRRPARWLYSSHLPRVRRTLRRYLSRRVHPRASRK